MARVLILGAGFAGHTAAAHAKRYLGKDHEVTVVAPVENWVMIPSNIWVGVGKMKKTDVSFPLAPIYDKAGIVFHQARAVSIHPEGNDQRESGYVTVSYTGQGKEGQTADIEYDYLINATGPKLNFGATPGLGPDTGESHSVCTPDHATEAWKDLSALIDAMKAGEKRTFLIGTGHGMATCQGAAFEYINNVDFVLRQEGVRDMARIIWLSNEEVLGDLGMGGVHVSQGGYITHSRVFTESLFKEKDFEWILKAHVKKVENKTVTYLNLDGEIHELSYDFAMLIPPFAGQGLKAMNKAGEDITATLFAPNGFLKVDADYTPKPYEEWSADDWPRTYQSPSYGNIFAAGIAFAPPHPISRVRKVVDPETGAEVQISPTPPRTGMPSGIIAHAVVKSIVDMIKTGADCPTHTAPMSRMGAACLASAGNSMISGSAAGITVYPVVPDFEKYPEYGRDMSLTTGQIGLAGHWLKAILHYLFIYKAKMKPLWWLIPE